MHDPLPGWICRALAVPDPDRRRAIPTRLSDLRIRQLTVADIDAADYLVKSAFRGEQSRRADLLRYLKIQPDGWLLAERGDRPVGMVGAIHYGSCAYIGFMAVDPPEQGQGIARVLMEDLLGWLAEAGGPMALLDASRAGAPLYVKLGFIDEGLTCRFELPGRRPAGPRPEEALPARMEDLSELEAFDAPIFGAPRGKVLAAYLAEFPDRAFLVRGPAGRIEGYLVAQEQRLGPWAARTEQAAEILLRAGLSLPFEDGAAVLAPDSNPVVRALLEANGFSLRDAIRHMRRGGESLLGMRPLIYGQASYAVG